MTGEKREDRTDEAVRSWPPTQNLREPEVQDAPPSAPQRSVNFHEIVALVRSAADRSDDFSLPSSGVAAGSIYFDIDGFVDPSRASAEHMRPVQTIGSSRDFSIIHYLLRSSMILDQRADAEVYKAFEEFSRACVPEALRVVGGAPMQLPVWVNEFQSKLAEARPQDRDLINSVEVALTIRPQIQAFSVPARGRVEVSAVSREHMRTINMLLLSVGEQVLAADSREASLDAAENLIEALLPWLLSLYFSDVNYSGLPILRANNRHVAEKAQRFARLQVEFMLAHEFAHVLLHHDAEPSRALEIEADKFAYDLLFDSEVFRVGVQSYDIHTAMRWLFLYLSLDRIIGATLSGYEVDWGNLPIRERDRPLIERVGTHRAPLRDQHIANLGDAMLFEAKGALWARGPAWLEQQAGSFREKFCAPPDDERARDEQ